MLNTNVPELLGFSFGGSMPNGSVLSQRHRIAPSLACVTMRGVLR
jgi:hypothetical protein